jgi:hypothetical protein
MTMEAMATMDPSEPNRPKRERDPVWLVPG